MLEYVGAGDIKNISRTHKVFLFGAGQKLEKFMKRYKDYKLEEIVEFIVDNSKEKWDTTININEKNIQIISLDKMLNYVDASAVIILMVGDAILPEIVEQLHACERLNKVPIYATKYCYYSEIEAYTKMCDKEALQDTIVANGEGDTHENALALFEYLEEHKLIGKYKWVWLCTHPEKYKSNDYVKYVKRDVASGAPTLEEVKENIYAMHTSKYIFYENIFLFKTRPEQIAVYLKHGTFMLKNVKGKIDIPEEVLGAICTSHSYADLASEQESIAKEKLIFCGSPRLDFLYKEKNVLKTLQCYEEEVKYILWLPTLRQTVLGRNDVGQIAPFGIPIVQAECDFEKLDKALEDSCMKLVIKPHPHQDLSVYKIGEYTNIIFIPQAKLDEYEFPIHSLMRECDALISDYSSIAFDYMLLDRPIAYTVDDMEDYKVGFSVPDPLYFMPGEKLKCLDDMCTYMEHVCDNIDVYCDERRKIRDYVHEFQGTDNSENFFNIMKMI